MTRRLSVAALLLCFRALAACGDEPDPTRCGDRCGRDQPVITSFSAERDVVTVGDGTFITAVFPDGTGGISNIGSVTSGVRIATGAMMETTTFVLSVTDTAGRRATSMLTVRVVEAPSVTSFVADRNVATENTTVVLTAVFSGGTAHIESPGGTRVDDVQSLERVAVTPAATTSYTLVVTNAAGDTAEAGALVVTYPRPTITRFESSHHPYVTVGRQTSVVAEFYGGDAVVTPGNIVVRSNVPFTTSTIAVDTTLTLTVTNYAGGTTTSEFTLVTVPEPAFISIVPNIPERGEHGLLDIAFIGESVRIEELGIVATSNGIVDVGVVNERKLLSLSVFNAAGDSDYDGAVILPVEGRSCLSILAANPSARTGMVAIKPAGTPRVVSCDGPWMVVLGSNSGRWSPTRGDARYEEDDFYKVADDTINALGADRLHRFESTFRRPQEMRAQTSDHDLFIASHRDWVDTDSDMGLTTSGIFWAAVASTPVQALQQGFSPLQDQDYFDTHAWGVTLDDCSAYSLAASARQFYAGASCDELSRGRISLRVTTRESFAQIVANAGPTALFRFEPFEDRQRFESSLGPSRSLTTTADVSTAIGLNPGESVAFDGATGRVTLPFSSDFNSSAFTTAFWIAPNENGGASQTIIDSSDAVGGYTIGLDQELHLTATAGSVTVTDPEPLVAGGTVFVALAIADGAMHLYKNAVDVAPSASVTWVANTTSALEIGADAANLTPFNGRLDDLAYFPSSKSALELREMFLAGGL